MVREKAPMLGKNLPLAASAGFGKRASMRFRAPPRPFASRRPRPLHDLPTSALPEGPQGRLTRAPDPETARPERDRAPRHAP
jgi:hypothetical protein